MQCHPVDNFRYLSFSHYPLSPPASQLSYWQFSLFTHQLHYVTPHSLTYQLFCQIVLPTRGRPQRTEWETLRWSQSTPKYQDILYEGISGSSFSRLSWDRAGWPGGYIDSRCGRIRQGGAGQGKIRDQIWDSNCQIDEIKWMRTYVLYIHVCLEHNYISCILFIHIFMLFIHVWLNVYGHEWFQLHFPFFANQIDLISCRAVSPIWDIYKVHLLSV